MLNKGSKSVEILFLVIIVLCFFGLIESILQDITLYHKIVSFESFLIYGGPLLISLCFVLVIRFGYKKARVSVLDETDFEKNKLFYRDVIKEYSVSTLNYIDEFKLEKKQAYTAKLLDLQNKKIIKIENGRIIVINNPVEPIDIQFVASIQNNKITMSLKDYENLIIEEALQKDLIVKNEDSKIKKYTKIMLISLFLVVIICAIVNVIIIRRNTIDSIDGYLIFMAIIVSIFMLIMFFTMAYFEKSKEKQMYKRTKKGQEINLKLDGLKLFMKKFSNINNKESQHLVLWEDYLIYSVMFNLNKNIQDEYAVFFEDI